MDTDEPIAHVSEDGRVHPLREHLEGTPAANMAGLEKKEKKIWNRI